MKAKRKCGKIVKERLIIEQIFWRISMGRMITE